jgi:hypothetical protein
MTTRKEKLVNAGAVGLGALAGYAVTKHFGREDMLAGWGVLGIVGIGGMLLRPDPLKRYGMTSLSAGLLAGLITAAFEEGGSLSNKPVMTGPPSVDWKRTYDEAVAGCLEGNAGACSTVERLRNRLKGAPVEVKVANRDPSTPQVSIDPARANAISACNGGDVQACCYLQNVKGEVPPKPCVTNTAAKARNFKETGVSGYSPGLCC